MAKFTFLEIHFDDSEFTATATAPFGPGEKDVEAGGPAPEPEAQASRKGTALAAVVGLLFLVGVALVAKRRFVTDDGPGAANDDAFEGIDD